MSLIQQALKRKQDEQLGTAAPPPPPLPSAPLASPPPVLSPLISGGGVMTPPSAAPKISIAHPVKHAGPPPVSVAEVVVEPEPKNSSGPLLAVVVLLLLLVGGAAWYFGIFKRPPATGAPSTTKATAPVTSPPVAKTAPEKKYTDVPSAIPLPNIGAVHEKVDKMKEAINNFRKEGSEATGIKPPLTAPVPEVTTPKPVPVPVPVVVTPAPVVPPPVAPVPVVVTPAVPVVWPAIKITGVMATSQKDHRTAFINDALVNVGDSVDGMVLIDVAENGVTLEFKGERRVVPVGRRH